MTTDIEKQFFETFGIETKKRFRGCKLGAKFYSEICKEPCKGCENEISKTEYPQITDRILLELICILGNTNYFLITDEGLPIDVDGLKKSILHSLTLQAKLSKNEGLKQQVQSLFKDNK